MNIEKIKNKLKPIVYPITNFIPRIRLRNKNFTIICDNCWAGKVYQELGLPYQTPFVGMFVFSPDYIKMLKNLKHYLSGNIPLKFVKESKYIKDFDNAYFVNTKEELKAVLFDKLDSKESLGSIVIASGVIPSEESLVIKNSSWFIRNSDSLDKNEFFHLSNEWRAIDGRGMAIFESFGTVTNAYRQVFLIMLALAYYRALHKISEELANVLAKPDNIQELDKLYTEAAIFNARYYFDNPIEFSRYPTFCAWEHIREAYHLRDKNNEVTSQLAQVHQILSYTQQKAEQSINEKRNWKLGVIGVILGGTGLIEAIDIIIQWFS